jgi:hypothetical protein
MLTHIALAIALAAPPSPQPADSVRTDREIRLTALRHVADVRRCYEREGLTRDTRLTGTMDVTVTILATGVVSDAAVTAHAMRGLGAREVGACLTTTMRNWRFERGPFAVERIVFPFHYTPESAPPVRVARSG